MSNELILLPLAQYPALAQGGGPSMANLGGEEVSAFDLPTIRRVGVTALAWEAGDPSNPETVKEVRGVILWTAPRRRRYTQAFGENPVPDCYSLDYYRGIGNPGGECDGCPCDGVDCHAHRPMLILREGKPAPEMLNVSLTSMANVKKWLMALGRPYWQVVARLWWVASQTKDGPKRGNGEGTKGGRPVARIAIETVGILDAEAQQRIALLVKQWGEALAQTRFDEPMGGEPQEA